MQVPGGREVRKGPSEEGGAALWLRSGPTAGAARFHLGMGGRGGAPRVAARRKHGENQACPPRLPPHTPPPSRHSRAVM